MAERSRRVDKSKRLEWLGERSRMIGGSDAPKIKRANPWAGPHDVWITKEPVRMALDLGQNEDTMNEVQQRGTDAEPIIAEHAEGRLLQRGWRVSAPFESIYMHPDHDVLGASWDMEIMDEDGLVGPLEIKSLGAFSHKWNGSVPAHVWYQVQHQMAMRPESRLAIVAAVRTDEKTWRAIIDGAFDLKTALQYGLASYEEYEVEKDQIYSEEVVPYLVEWWESYVETATPPPADDTDGCTESLRAAFPNKAGQLSMSTEMLDLLRDREAVKAQISALNKDKKLFDNRIREPLAGSASMKGDAGSVSISRQSTKRLDSGRLQEE